MSGEPVVFLDRMCVCGHADSEHSSHYYETGNRAPVCERRSCSCAHFLARAERMT